MTHATNLELENQLEQLDEYTATGTTLVSLYIPPESNLTNEHKRIQSEKSEAQNIKSKTTRSDVLDALDKIDRLFNELSPDTETGYALFAGNPRETTSTVATVITPETPITQSLYHCGKEFKTDPLWNTVESAPEFGVVLLDLSKAVIATIAGSNTTIHETLYSRVPSKHTKGGQSQARFERVRDKEIHKFYNQIGNRVSDTFSNEINGLLIGGPEHTRNRFVTEEYLPHDSIIIYEGSVSSITKAGVNELVKNAQTAIKDSQIEQENKLINEFLTGIKTNTATYGRTEIIQAAEYGAIKKILICKSKYKNAETSQLKTLADEYGSEFVVLDCQSEKGNQFKTAFNGLGALLRFPIN